MTIKQVLLKYHQIEIDLLLSNILGKTREFLYMNPETKLTIKQLNNLTKLIKRRLKGEPIAYILGYKDFYGLRFKVNRNVLIPRPETEVLVEKVLQLLLPERSRRLRVADLTLRQAQGSKLRILDVGTGSGCIAISLSKNLKVKGKKIEIVASDISKKALSIAEYNAKKHKVKIDFIKSDLLSNVKFNPDIVVANLPYVPRRIYNLKFKNLKFEPKVALVDAKKDSDIYQRFLKQVVALPSLPKTVFLEIDPSQKLFLLQIVKKYLPKADIKFSKDFNSLWRFLEIKI